MRVGSDAGYDGHDYGADDSMGISHLDWPFLIKVRTHVHPHSSLAPLHPLQFREKANICKCKYSPTHAPVIRTVF